MREFLEILGRGYARKMRRVDEKMRDKEENCGKILVCG
jgi:hypothetical protein